MNDSWTHSHQVVRFLTLFAKVKDVSNGDPSVLEKLAVDRDDIQSLCINLATSAGILRVRERQKSGFYIENVGPLFLKSWEEYNTRYSIVVNRIWLPVLAAETTPAGSTKKLQKETWEEAEFEAVEECLALECVFAFAKEQIDQSDRWAEFQDLVWQQHDGHAAWSKMKNQIGLDPHVSFRRRNLIPSIMIPTKVSNKHGSAELISLFSQLDAAIRAFVFQADQAAVAMLRATLETVLTRHYGATEKDLSGKIREVRAKLPPGVSTFALDDIRRDANAFLHGDSVRFRKVRHIDIFEFETNFVDYLRALKKLIENDRLWEKGAV